MLADALPVPVKFLPFEVKVYETIGLGHGYNATALNIVIDNLHTRSLPSFNGTLPDYPPLSPADALLYGGYNMTMIEH